MGGNLAALLADAETYAFRLSGLRARLLLLGGFAYLVLATGAIFPLRVGGHLFFGHTVAIGLVMVAMARMPQVRAAAPRAFLLLLPYAAVVVVSALAWSGAPFYALQKIEGAVIATLVAASLWIYMLAKYDEKEALFSFALVSFAALGCTLIYKGTLGLGDRGVRFFINGPIVFGWIMGWNFLICLYLFFKGFRRWIVACGAVAFFLAVLWTQSKGPLIATGAIALIAVFSMRGIKASLVGAIALAGIMVLTYFLVPEATQRLETIWHFAANGFEGSGARTIVVRLAAAELSVSLFRDNWLSGVGLANWSSYADALPLIEHLDYPHNFLLEAASETGLLGLIALLGTLLYLFLHCGTFGKLLIVYFGLCLSFSGDAPYLRFLLTYPIAYVATASIRGSE